MDQTDLRPLIADVSHDITVLTEALSPVLNIPLSTLSSQLPLLERAKLNILVTYTIESLLFSTLRLSGADAKQHHVFTELARVRQYFEKVKLAEEGPAQRIQKVDQEAAARIVKHGLAGNDKMMRASGAPIKNEKNPKRSVDVAEGDAAQDKKKRRKKHKKSTKDDS